MIESKIKLKINGNKGLQQWLVNMHTVEIQLLQNKKNPLHMYSYMHICTVRKYLKYSMQLLH